MGAGFEQGSVWHSQGELIDAQHLSACADLLMTTSPSVIVYAGIDGWRRQMVEDGYQLLTRALAVTSDVRQRLDALPGLHVLHHELLGVEASHDLDPMHVLIDLSELGVSGYQAADWLRGHCRIDMGLSDHRRIEATMSMADDADNADRLIGALTRFIAAAPSLPRAVPVDLPSPHVFELEPVLLPAAVAAAPDGRRGPIGQSWTSHRRRYSRQSISTTATGSTPSRCRTTCLAYGARIMDRTAATAPRPA
jgi:hypothetical protein